MPLSAYFNTFTYTHFTKDVTDWSSDHFLMLGDDTHNENPGSFYYCGDDCTKHTLIISTTVTQTVYLTAHTWDERSMGDSCRDLWYNT